MTGLDFGLLAAGLHTGLGLLQRPGLDAATNVWAWAWTKENIQDSPGIRLVVEQDRCQPHGAVHPNIPDVLPRLLLALLAGRQWLRLASTRK